MASSMRWAIRRSSSRRTWLTNRAMSRATPSDSSSGVTSRSRATSPCVPNGAVETGSNATILRLNSPGPKVKSRTRSSSAAASYSYDPDFMAATTAGVDLPSRGPTTGRSTWKTSSPSSDCSAKRTWRTFTSSAMRSAKGRRRSASDEATVSDERGRRTRRPLALRTAEAAEQTSRTRSMAATSSGSPANPVGSGQSARCTLAAPVSGR